MAQKLCHESVVSLDPCHPLTESDVYERGLHEDIGTRWMELARKLGFQKSVIDSIKSDNPSEKERCVDLLVQWMEKEGRDEATAGKLAEALTDIGLKTLAEKLLGPLNGRRKIVIEITGTIKLNDNYEVMLGIDRYGKTIFFMWESEGKEFKTSLEELKNYVDASSCIAAETVEITGEMDSSAERANNGFTEEEQRISSQLEDLQGKLMDMVKSLEIPELKGDAFARTSKLDFIDKQSRTLQELYTEVTGMTRKACNCNHTLRRTFYDFAYHSLRSLHNDLSARLGDLESEKDGMTEEEKRNLKNLVSYRDGRESQIIQLERRWIRLFSPVDELKKSQTFPSQRLTQITAQNFRFNSDGAQLKDLKTKSKIPRIKKKKTQDKASCVLTSYKTDNDRNQDKDSMDKI
ncbi:uncharacterized protein LOC113675027 isoform X2 [Pocillopora damicornis]|uniref:uncharacterized protein LOC113675027 isoform X2 n=1 Tax=Pocillopora damicornis TaxID=46731 RepID=UPI000F54D19E|nr:uncharacterized protein LOC113675027 isoform X2 [Pocillopora damicornis]